jgi:hypothetical protein
MKALQDADRRGADSARRQFRAARAITLTLGGQDLVRTVLDCLDRMRGARALR